jgi:hypothetical protein
MYVLTIEINTTPPHTPITVVWDTDLHTTTSQGILTRMDVTSLLFLSFLFLHMNMSHSHPDTQTRVLG